METLVIIPDLQIPQHDIKAVSVAQQLIKAMKPDIAVYIGDVIAADSVSSYSKTSWDEAAKTLRGEAETTNSVLDGFDKVLKTCKDIYFLEGNHEERIIKWVVKNTAPLGEILALRIENLLRLEDRGYHYIPLNKQPLRINRFNLIHGWYTNQYHAAKTLRMAHQNTFYGHTHDYQVQTSGHYEDEPPRMAMSCGCLCDYRQDYLGSRPTNWMQGITYIEYDDRTFQVHFISIIEGRAIWNKKVFEA